MQSVRMKGVGGLLLLLGVLVLVAGCNRSSSSNNNRKGGKLTGVVMDGAGVVVVGATVYLVPTDQIDMTPITAMGVLDGSAAAYDEPLEDAVRVAGMTFLSAVTNTAGKYAISKIPDGSFFLYVEPAATDMAHYPGGDQCRASFMAGALRGKKIDIKLSGRPSPAATHVGTTNCLTCHADYVGETYTAHKLGIMDIQGPGALQNTTNFPDFFNYPALFTPSATHTGGTVVALGDYTSGRSFDKFKAYQGMAPPQITLVYAHVYLWQDTANGLYKASIVNALNVGDPIMHLTVRLTYGGAVYKQRLLVEHAGRNGLYPFLQYQGYAGISTGDDNKYDRSRGVFRDYHLDWLWDAGGDTTFGTADDFLKLPSASNTFGSKCASCHFNGFTAMQDMGTGEWLADAVDDVGGAYDIDGDGNLDEVNLGCENCHGAGSEHVMAGDGSAIVSPEYLTPSRSNQICGRCHDRTVGAGTIGGDSPVDMNNRMMPPGESRDTFITNYTTQPGPAMSKLWPDGLHAKSHHQQWPDLMKSDHYRNGKVLTTCADCHDPHADRSAAGLPEFPHQMLYDQDDPNSLLCQRCHTVDISQHMLEKTGSIKSGGQVNCFDCHMARTAKTGPGDYGLLLGAPDGSSADDDITYFMNDIGSHVFDVPDKFSVGVQGVKPAKAMPIPYTNRCAACHDASSLQY